MRWIKSDEEFKEVWLEARRCVYIDSGREDTALVKLEFDDVELLSGEFIDLIKALMGWSAEKERATYVVLDPDPVYFFRNQFGRYPSIEFSESDSAEVLLGALTEELKGNAAAAIGINYWEFVIVGSFHQWFVHALRSEGQRGGHLWIPKNWTDRVREIYPYALPPNLGTTQDLQ